MTRSLRLAWPGFALLVAAAACLFTCSTCGLLPIESSSDPGFALGSVDRAADGSMTRGRLLESRTIDGWPVTGWVSWSGGQLAAFDLAEDFSPPGWTAGRSLPAGTRVTMVAGSPDVVDFVFFPHDLVLDGIPIAGGAEKVMCGFFPDGSLRYAFLSDDAEVAGLPVAASLFTPLRFHPNGSVESCLLSKEVELEGRTLDKGATVHFDETGHLLRVD